jgi:hypothetical protein
LKKKIPKNISERKIRIEIKMKKVSRILKKKIEKNISGHKIRIESKK